MQITGRVFWSLADFRSSQQCTILDSQDQRSRRLLVVYHEAKSISYLLILKRQRAESLPVGCFTASHGASLDNCNPELASSAIAMLKVCIHDVIDCWRKTENSLGTGLRSVGNNWYFPWKFRSCLNLFSVSVGIKTFPYWTVLRMRSVPNRTKKNEPLWFALSKELEKWSLHFLICNKERRRHVQEIIMHMNTPCVAQPEPFLRHCLCRCRLVLRINSLTKNHDADAEDNVD